MAQGCLAVFRTAFVLLAVLMESLLASLVTVTHADDIPGSPGSLQSLFALARKSSPKPDAASLARPVRPQTPKLKSASLASKPNSSTLAQAVRSGRGRSLAATCELTAPKFYCVQMAAAYQGLLDAGVKGKPSIPAMYQSLNDCGVKFSVCSKYFWFLGWGSGAMAVAQRFAIKPATLTNICKFVKPIFDNGVRPPAACGPFHVCSANAQNGLRTFFNLARQIC